MDAERFDQLATIFAGVGTRRLVIGGLIGGVLGRMRAGVTGATHGTDHHCTPSDQHACPDEQTCRMVNGAWTCQDTCGAPGAPCETDYDCCSINGLQFCILEQSVCDNDPGTD